MSPSRVLRIVAVGWWLHLKMMSRSALQGVLMVMWPLFFATTALLMFRVHGSRDDLFFAALGGSVMAIWSAVGTVASEILQLERRSGTLELLVGAPAPFAVVAFPITLAVSTVGVYGMVTTLVWARLLFGIEVTVAKPLLFGAAVIVTVLAIAALGFVMSVTAVRYRQSWALGNAFEYPVWLVCGLLVPVSMFPGWIRPISWILAPTWGMQAIRGAATGDAMLGSLAVCAGLAAAYLALGVGLSGTMLNSARRHATLTLT
jgi:ABC-2 type transport system permease protein